MARGAKPDQQGFLIETHTGSNAGDGMMPMGAWFNYGRSDFDNSFATMAYDGNRDSFLGGVDIVPREDVVVGIAFGYEDSDIDTFFNQGQQETDGFTVAPYVGALINETWSVDATFGYSWLDTSQFRTVPGTATRVNSSVDSTRWFINGNVNGYWGIGNWLLGGRTGLLWAQLDQDQFTESDSTVISGQESELGTWYIAGDVSYQWRKFEPFAGLTYEYDFQLTEQAVLTGPQPSNDDDDFLVRAGLRYFGPYGVSGNFEWYKRLDRADFDEDVYNLTVRVEF
jgi:uncharacterized protein with beta-barrel porin domain